MAPSTKSSKVVHRRRMKEDPEYAATFRAKERKRQMTGKCSNCGGPVDSRSTTRICYLQPECRSLLRRSTFTHGGKSNGGVKVDPSRRCEKCDGPLTTRNTIGICYSNPTCKKAAKKVKDARYEKKKRKSRADPSKKRGPKKEKGPLYLIPEDGIVDDLAVALAFQGTRKVGLTPTEREIVTQKMVNAAVYGVADIADHLGAPIKDVLIILDKLGYDVVKDDMQSGSSRRRVILPKDRVKGKKMLDDVLVSPKP